MGKGSNLQKKQAARARHEKDAQKPQGGGGQAGKASQSDAQLKGHQENKHPTRTFADCFPERAKAQ